MNAPDEALGANAELTRRVRFKQIDQRLVVGALALEHLGSALTGSLTRLTAVSFLGVTGRGRPVAAVRLSKKQTLEETQAAAKDRLSHINR